MSTHSSQNNKKNNYTVLSPLYGVDIFYSIWWDSYGQITCDDDIDDIWNKLHLDSSIIPENDILYGYFEKNPYRFKRVGTYIPNLKLYENVDDINLPWDIFYCEALFYAKSLVQSNKSLKVNPIMSEFLNALSDDSFAELLNELIKQTK